jgi:asparagine synthase (glutamine-hydrolysing)
MAGVFGLLGLQDEQILPAMARRLAHRGSAAEMREAAQGVSLGCVGDRVVPGILEHDRWTLVADLAVYNQPELRAAQELDEDQARGAGGLLLALYRRFGGQGLAMINGDFALALWDSGAQELILARDFTGVRPLYWARRPDGGIAFASEYKALLAVEEIPAEPDLDMVQCLQCSKHLPSARTLIREVRAVPPGAAMALDRAGNLRWQAAMPPLELAVEHMSLDTACSRLADAFMRAAEARIAGESTIGVALSGGIDSIAVACASRQSQPSREIHTFTVGDGPDDPEILRAEFVADKIGARQHSVVVTPDAMVAQLPDLVWHLETPIARTETLQFYALGQEAGRFVDLLQTGVAGDGLLGGMPRHKLLWLIHHLPFLRAPLTEFYSLTQSGRPPQTTAGKLLDQLYFRGSVAAVPAVRQSDFRPKLPDFPANSQEFLNQVMCGGFQEAVATWLPKVERTLGAAGVRFSSPYLDRDLMRIAFTIPSAYKIHRGKEKYVLRQALKAIIPPEVLNAPKFPMRMRYDRQFSDTLDSLADRILSKERLEARGFMAPAAVEELRRRRPGRPYSPEGAMRLWTAVLTEIWACEFLDLRGARPAAARELGIADVAVGRATDLAALARISHRE